MRHLRSGWRPLRASLALPLAVVLVVSACDLGGAPAASQRPSQPPPTTSAPSSAARPSPAPTTAPTVAPSEVPVAPTAPPAAGRLAAGVLAETVSGGLRVRSRPEVSAASVKYRPLLPKGTQLVVLDGPVKASGYTWYRVMPLGVRLQAGIEAGWVAIADHDGTPWVAVASDPTPGYELASVRAVRPRAVVADAKAAAASVNAFGIDLYKRMVRDPSLGLAEAGVVFSPTSIAIALGMARAGARGVTADEMDKVLHSSGWDRYGPSLGSLQQVLASRDAAWTTADGADRALSLRIANQGFAQRDWPVKQPYLEDIARTLGAGMGLIDYKNDLDGARRAINGWVARQTVNRIPQLLGPDDLTSDTRLALVNAVYLKAAWLLEFPSWATRNRPFTRLDGSKVKVPTMRLTGGQEVPYARGTGWQATELRYEGPDGAPLAMTLILPEKLGAFERGLTPSMFSTIVKRLAAERKRLSVIESKPSSDCDIETYAYSLDLYLPRFSLDTRAELVPVLQAMGMTTATDEVRADFTGIADPNPYPLYIQKVIHQANIDVDEEGTEASAATAVIMGETGGGCYAVPRREITLRLDRPFLFAIRDVQTGAILFMGRAVDPATS